MAFLKFMNIFTFHLESHTSSHGHYFISESTVTRLEPNKISLSYRFLPKVYPHGILRSVFHLNSCIVNYGEAIQDSVVVFHKFPNKWLRFIGHLEILSEFSLVWRFLKLEMTCLSMGWRRGDVLRGRNFSLMK